jgi:FkbM family methyltransferase
MKAVMFSVLERVNLRCLVLVDIAGEPIYVRTATSDFSVAVSSLVDSEFGHVDSLDPSVIVDAGANIGASAIYFAKRYPHAKVFAIEPERENYEILLMNVRRHRNIIPIQAALWGSSGTRMLQDRLTGPWGYTIAETINRVESTGQRIDCITIASLLDEYKIEHVDILKLDIEGGEKDVLENSVDWIDKVNVITAELHDRICMGCERAFHLATRDFKRFEKHGEKVTAYRE